MHDNVWQTQASVHITYSVTKQAQPQVTENHTKYMQSIGTVSQLAEACSLAGMSHNIMHSAH